MMFLDKSRFGLTDSSFLGGYHIAYAFADSILTPEGRTPSDSNAIDIKKNIGIIKLYEEANERKRLSYGLLKDNNCIVFDYINKYWKEYPSRYFAYGFNEKYGFADTTGTSSGYISKDVLMKSIEELIEKNEMAFFWYLKKGYYINPNTAIKSLINKHNFKSDEISIFECRTLSNMYAYFVLLFDNKRFIASGACASLNSDIALEGAIDEAKLLEWQNYCNIRSTIARLKDIEFQNIYNYYLSLKKKSKYFSSHVSNKLKFSDRIESLDIAILNTMDNHKSITIKCASEELLSCIPRKNNIDQNNSELSKKIRGLDYKLTPDCILL